jgi:hypothetical protein
MVRSALLALLMVVTAAGCGGRDATIDAGWGLTCASSRVTSTAIAPSEGAGETTPEAAIAVFVTNPLVRLPAGGWERADFIATEQGTVPLTVPVPQAAFVRRDGDRIDQVLTLEQLPSGWVVTGAHQCADS